MLCENGSGVVLSTELVAALLSVDANVGFARAVVEGMVGGQVWTTGSGSPVAGHVVHPYGMSLIWGDGVDAAFEELVIRLREGRYRVRDEWLQIDPRWAHLPWEQVLTAPGGGPVGVEVHERVNFDFDPDLFAATLPQVGVAEGWSVTRADASDFDRPGSVVPAEFWRNAEEFLAHGGGRRAERDGFRGALAFASFRFDHELELGIETHPDARGRGLATAVAARMIEDLLAQGVTPVWSCRDSNFASVALATKLGFLPGKRLPYFGLPAAQVSFPLMTRWSCGERTEPHRG